MARHKVHRDRSDAPQRKAALANMMREGIPPPAGRACDAKLLNLAATQMDGDLLSGRTAQADAGSR